MDALREFYSYSSELGKNNSENIYFLITLLISCTFYIKERGIPMLLNVLCKDGGTTKDLDGHPGLTRLFAEILDFVFEFDYLKIRNPTIQNDFSFYRRTLQRGRESRTAAKTTAPTNDQSDLRLAINEDDLANRISLFIAYPTPMLKCVIDTTTKYVESNQLVKCTSEWLASIWAACYQTLNTNYKKANNNSVDTFCLKVMVVSIILYDHIDPNGAFAKNSPINVKSSLKTIQNVNQINRQEQSSTSNLICALRYNSKHLNDESTPKGIKNFVMAI